jgi:hypothetical protein
VTVTCAPAGHHPLRVVGRLQFAQAGQGGHRVEGLGIGSGFAEVQVVPVRAPRSDGCQECLKVSFHGDGRFGRGRDTDGEAKESARQLIDGAAPGVRSADGPADVAEIDRQQSGLQHHAED